MVRYCSKCGTPLSDKAAFCKGCGSPVKNRQTAVQDAGGRVANGLAQPQPQAQAQARVQAQVRQVQPQPQPQTVGPIRNAARSRSAAREPMNIPAVALAAGASAFAIGAVVVWIVGAFASHEQAIRSFGALTDEAAWIGGLSYVCLAGIPALVSLLVGLSLAGGAARVVQREDVPVRCVVGASIAFALCALALVFALAGARIPLFSAGEAATIVTTMAGAYSTTAVIASLLAAATTVASVFARRLSRTAS